MEFGAFLTFSCNVWQKEQIFRICGSRHRLLECGAVRTVPWNVGRI